KQGMEIDIPQIPDLIVDNTDRNRTSPFAFTGNRFEFRAPGSTANCASAMISLNAAMAEALESFKERVNKKIADGDNKVSAILDVLRDDIKTCKPIRFDGNGYSDEWVKEAARRGLDVEKSCPVIFERYLDDSSVKMFESTKVMNRKELEARNEVKWEMFVKTVQIEARVLGDLAMNHIIPVATHYQSKLIKNVQGMKDVFTAEKATRLSTRNMKLIEEIAERTEKIEQFTEELTDARKVANRIEDIHERAIAYHDTVEPHMEAIRYEVDKLELIVEDGLWTLPKYRELLFIR
ncbi:MAG: glutamine synthetase type III, partial [Prevotella sp.]|nr:glutamine synthetase type III [Prevotella sp.]